MAEIVREVYLCTDCMLHHCNGECGSCAWCTGEESESPLPLSALTGRDRRLLAMGAHEHSEHCTEEDRKEGCDCGHVPFALFDCAGCGRRVAGDRFDFVIFDS